MRKVFPDGFDGIAHNFRLSLITGDSVDAFMKRNNGLLVKKKGGHDVFPIDLNYVDKMDLILFAKNSDHLYQL